LKSKNIKQIVYSLLALVTVLGLYFFYWQNNVQENVEAKGATVVNDVKPITPPELVKIELPLPIKQRQPDLLLDLCENYLMPIEDISLWSKEKKSEIKAFYQTLANNNVERTQLDYISIYSGVHFSRGRGYSLDLFKRRVLPHLADEKAVLMTDSATALFSKLFAKDKFDELVEAFSTGSLPLNSYVYYPYKVVHPISHILQKDNSEQGRNAVLQLIELGAKPTFIDLITATELSLPLAFVDALYMAGEVDATRVYYDSSFYHSLSLVATKSLAPDLVSYWLSLNSPPSPDPFTLNALDLIAFPKTENQKNAFIEIFPLLMKSGARANYQPTVDKLLSWLPKDLIDNYKSNLSEINDRKMPESWKAFVYVNVFELYKIALRGHLREEGSDVITNPCFLLMGNKMVRLAVSQKSKPTALEIIVKSTSFEADAKKLIKDSRLGDITIDEVIDNLSVRNDLVGKLAIQELLLSKVYNQLESQNNRFKDETSKEQREAVESALSALKLDDWQNIEEIISDIEGTSDKEELDILITLAITSNQDWLIIKKLLEQGADLPENSIILLAQSNNILLARRLIPYGLNIKFIDNIGNNAFYYSVIFNAKDMIVFLLSQGVELNINTKGLDPLDHALSLIKYQAEMIEIVGLLIDGGINISKSHKERTASYSSSSPEIYSLLISKFPQLLD
jgi:hypothetical protein